MPCWFSSTDWEGRGTKKNIVFLSFIERTPREFTSEPVDVVEAFPDGINVGVVQL
jgi:hypothetical protein